MQAGYMVVAKDGKEYGPLDRDTIQQWYYEGRLDRNAMITEPGGNEFRLKEMFDLTVWNNPALITQAAAASTGQATFEPKMMAGDDGERTPGMFAAGILLIINAVLGILAIGFTLVWQVGPLVNPRGYIMPIIDLIVAAGLIRGNEKFRKWGLIRAVLGGGFILLGALLQAKMPSSVTSQVSVALVSGWTEAVFQLIFCAGMAALLWGEWPSHKRVAIGVSAVLVGWFGVISTSVVTGLVGGFRESAEIARYSVATGSFHDQQAGVSAKMSEGWALLTKDNPIVRVPDATLVAVHNSTGCFAALLVEPAAGFTDSTDDYLTLVLENRQRSTPNMRDVGRHDVVFGGYQGRRLDVSWTQQGMKFRGFSTACKAGSKYYLLTGWCLDNDFPKAFPEFQSLEKGFMVGVRPASGPLEITSESEEEDFYDLVFFIEDHKKLPNGAQTILARGTHEGSAVGFEVSLGPAWREGSLDPELSLTTYSGKATYRSIGPESDSFVQVLNQIYQSKLSPKRMASEVPFAVIGLEGNPGDLAKGPVKLKMFFESSRDDRYAELYTNIDLAARKIFVSEKDPEYREAIIRALQAR